MCVCLALINNNVSFNKLDKEAAVFGPHIAYKKIPDLKENIQGEQILI